MENRIVFKVLVLGDEAVGKTSLVKRFTEGIYPTVSPQTIGVDFDIKEVDLADVRVKLQIWDFGGQEHYRRIQYSFCEGAKGVILVFDLSRPETLNSIPEWISFLNNCLDKEVPVILVGAKTDIKSNNIAYEKIREFSNSSQIIGYFETSAKENISIQPPFYYLSKKMLNQYFQALTVQK
ncbi:MAG: Rab family GTPase [Candidatus Odinarchaeia archaeon]